MLFSKKGKQMKITQYMIVFVYGFFIMSTHKVVSWFGVTAVVPNRMISIACCIMFGLLVFRVVRFLAKTKLIPKEVFAVVLATGVLSGAFVLDMDSQSLMVDISNSLNALVLIMIVGLGFGTILSQWLNQAKTSWPLEFEATIIFMTVFGYILMTPGIVGLMALIVCGIAIPAVVISLNKYENRQATQTQAI